MAAITERHKGLAKMILALGEFYDFDDIEESLYPEQDAAQRVFVKAALDLAKEVS